jgi:hypothetical protein
MMSPVLRDRLAAQDQSREGHAVPHADFLTGPMITLLADNLLR